MIRLLPYRENHVSETLSLAYESHRIGHAQNAAASKSYNVSEVVQICRNDTARLSQKGPYKYGTYHGTGIGQMSSAASKKFVCGWSSGALGTWLGW